MRLQAGSGSEAVIVGLNGDGGVTAVFNSPGKKLWQQPDGNVWHVEIATPDNGSDAMILHTNARGQLVLRELPVMLLDIPNQKLTCPISP